MVRPPSARVRYRLDTVPTPFYNFAAALSWPVFHGLYRLRSTGAENVPKGGAVLAANHTSNFDPWPLGFPLWPGQQLYFMGKSELFNPVLAPVPARRWGAFPVRRGESDIQAIQTAVSLCKQGKIVAMFPEGTRRQKGLRKKFTPRAHHGARRASRSRRACPSCPQRSRAPTGCSASRSSRSPTARRFRSTTSYGLPPKDAVETATQRLMAEIESLHDSL